MSVEAKAMQLLGKNISQEVVAAACGVTPGRISQLMADEEFRAQVQELKFKNISQVTQLDETYDSLEERTLAKLKTSLDAMWKPRELLHAIQVLNSAKRRGNIVADPTAVPASRSIALTMPVMIVNKFIKNINNQILEVQDNEGRRQPLTTASTDKLSKLAKSALEQKPNDTETSQTRFDPGSINQTKIERKIKVTADDL